VLHVEGAVDQPSSSIASSRASASSRAILRPHDGKSCSPSGSGEIARTTSPTCDCTASPAPPAPCGRCKHHAERGAVVDDPRRTLSVAPVPRAGRRCAHRPGRPAPSPGGAPRVLIRAGNVLLEQLRQLAIDPAAAGTRRSRSRTQQRVARPRPPARHPSRPAVRSPAPRRPAAAPDRENQPFAAISSSCARSASTGRRIRRAIASTRSGTGSSDAATAASSGEKSVRGSSARPPDPVAG